MFEDPPEGGEIDAARGVDFSNAAKAVIVGCVMNPSFHSGGTRSGFSKSFLENLSKLAKQTCEGWLEIILRLCMWRLADLEVLMKVLTTCSLLL